MLSDAIEFIVELIFAAFGGRHERQLTLGCLSVVGIAGLVLLGAIALVVWLVWLR